MNSDDGCEFVWRNRSVYSRDACFGQVIYPPGGYYGPRTQADYQLVIIHSGDAEVTVDGERRGLPVGSVALLLPGHRERFQFSSDRETHHSWCAVSVGGMPEAMVDRLEKAPFIAPISCVFSRLLSTGLLMDTPHSLPADCVISQLAVLLFAEFLRMADRCSPQSDQAESLKRALGYMEDHLAEDDCLSVAYRCSGVSRSALIQHFAQEIGLPPGRYLWRLRTERGISMLGKTGLTVSEIAYQCGFKTPFHFSRLVKQHQGVSPREVRKRAWDE